MTMTAREAFERGTDTFNAHDIDGFAEVLADDVVFEAPGGMRGEGKAACAEFFGGWFGAFPDAHVEVHGLHIVGDVAVEEGTFTGTHDGVLHSPAGDIPPTGRPVRIGLHPGAPLPRRQARLVQPDVRPARDARTARPRPDACGDGLTRADLRGRSSDRAAVLVAEPPHLPGAAGQLHASCSRRAGRPSPAGRDGPGRTARDG